MSFRLILSALFFSLCRADLIPFIQDESYDLGDFGSYPTQDFRSSPLKAPRVNILQSDPTCTSGSYIFLNPRGHKVPYPNPMILDEAGNLVWTLDGDLYGQTYNLNVQEHDGQQYLTFWGGNDAVGGHGEGYYYMLDSSYTQVRRLDAHGPINGDLHEFRFTDEGTALYTVYGITQMDLSPIGGPTSGWVWDGQIQEIDLKTGELLFEWKSTDHYSAEDTYHEYVSGGTSSHSPFDYFHINSIDKDPKGNYLISARYTHSITYIDGRTGDIIWQLGGKKNQFKDLTDGRATNFAYQHDAHWHDNYTTVTVFDNGAESGKYTAEYSRGLRIKLDQQRMLAELQTEYVNPQHIISSSQGSLQVLPNGNVLLGYGYNGAFTEFSEDGAVLCDTHFAAASSFESGDVQSYRALKYKWSATPITSASINIEGQSVFVSWNGATDVHRWVLQNADYADADTHGWYPVQTVERSGFETELRYGDSVKKYVRVLALDKEGTVLGVSGIGSARFEKTDQSGIMSTVSIKNADAVPLLLLVIALGIGSAATAAVWGVMAWRKRKEWTKYQHLRGEDAEDVDVETVHLDTRQFTVRS
ncbi:hypothetical protein K490DRAFT_66847 [Saccharata proteae CBS 121410]|uniref:Arylsulfotransferase n=1 Tax=Saccharata proteae CBS 121410 TaxID=1314787 RepID=A0A9P4LWC3_9PEZI|nr:hypothetical protein K490DRAFT_66847 [Saccharata proteae CBS 121410]